ncbi:MAG TPA: ABC transporter substrate-binding protein [Bordetella sp.]
MNQSAAWAARRRFLQGSLGATAAIMAGKTGLALAQPAEPLKKVSIAWSATAVCTVPVPAALEQGYFRKYGLDVSFINFAGSTDQLLEAIASGKAQAGVGMALRWLKPLEQGFDVKIISGVMSGCIRLLVAKDSPYASVADLKGKTIGVSDMASPAKNFFSILLGQAGVDPEKDVAWRAYPADLLGQGLQKGEVHAVADNDPIISLVRKNFGLRELASNMTGKYADRSCCVLAVSGNMVRNDFKTAQALAAAIQEGSEWTAENPRKAAELFASYSPKVPVDDLVEMLAGMSHHHHPVHQPLKQEIADYVEELKAIHVISPGIDPQKFAAAVTADV